MIRFVSIFFFLSAMCSSAFALDLSGWLGEYEGHSGLFKKCRFLVTPAQDSSKLDFYIQNDEGNIPFTDITDDLLPALEAGTNPVMIEEPRRCGMGCISGTYYLTLGEDGLPSRFQGVAEYFYGIKRPFDCRDLKKVSR